MVRIPRDSGERLAIMKPLHEQYIVDGGGKKTAVILPIEQYEKLMADLHDLAVIAERRKEELVSFDEVKRRLKDDGLL